MLIGRRIRRIQTLYTEFCEPEKTTGPVCREFQVIRMMNQCASIRLPCNASAWRSPLSEWRADEATLLEVTSRVIVIIQDRTGSANPRLFPELRSCPLQISQRNDGRSFSKY